MKPSRILLIGAALLLPLPAQAAHPLTTDDTGTQGRGGIQLELTTEYGRDNSDDDGTTLSEKTSSTAATLSYGLSDEIDLVAALPYEWYRTREEGTTTGREEGVGDIELALKWRFFDDEESRLSLALKPGLSLPTGDEEKGLGSGRVSGSLSLSATHQGDLGALHANIGYAYRTFRLEADRDILRHDIWSASLAAELNLTGSIRGVGEIGTETHEEKASDEGPSFILGGLIYEATDDIDIDLGVKGALNDAETDTTLLAGLTLRF